jgi:hypothetical protein
MFSKHILRVRRFIDEDSFERFEGKAGFIMKIVKGWRRIDNERGFVNETTGQNLAVRKKEFGQHYIVVLFPNLGVEAEGKTVSPEFAAEAKAEAFAMDWMSKNINGSN